MRAARRAGREEVGEFVEEELDGEVGEEFDEEVEFEPSHKLWDDKTHLCVYDLEPFRRSFVLWIP